MKASPNTVTKSYLVKINEWRSEQADSRTPPLEQRRRPRPGWSGCPAVADDLWRALRIPKALFHWTGRPRGQGVSKTTRSLSRCSRVPWKAEATSAWEHSVMAPTSARFTTWLPALEILSKMALMGDVRSLRHIFCLDGAPAKN